MGEGVREEWGRSGGRVKKWGKEWGKEWRRSGGGMGG